MLAITDLSWLGVGLNLALMLGLLVCSGAFSGSETVLFSLSRTQLEQAAGSANPFRRSAARLMRRPRDTLLVILLANTAVNVALFAVSYVFFGQLAASSSPWVTPVAGLVSVLVVVVFGEVVPKVLAVRFAERAAPLAAALVGPVGYVARPLGRIIDLLIAEPFRRVVLGRPTRGPTPRHDVSVEELKALLQMSRRRGEIDRVEDRFLREIVDLGSLRVRDLMVPRVEVEAYDIDEPAEGLRALMRETRLKKVPVYEGSMDNVVGLVYAKMLFLEADRPLREVVMPVRFVPDLATCEHLLQHFRETRTQLAIAVDEFGGMAGLVTLEDVLEAIVGDISDPEEALGEPETHQLSESEYEISGQLDVRYWTQTFGLPRQTERVATVGGLVTARLGRPAQIGDVVELGNVELHVTSVQRRRVHRLRLVRRPAVGESEVPA
ncbi:MAG: hemolysin family protein [Phycisphaerae bacterium]|jgi:putative hemolysin